MPHDPIHLCERCHRRVELYHIRSVDEYLCEHCIMLLVAQERDAVEDAPDE